MIDMEQAMQGLGSRIVDAARLAVAAHVDQALSGLSADPDVRRFRQRMMTGGAGLATAPLGAAGFFTEEALPSAATSAARPSPAEASQPSSLCREGERA
jgi:hypothetical protein